MKTSLKKLQKFVAPKHDRRSRKQHRSPAQDELARATRDMNDMRDCYDRLLSAAAATENSVYEFSESLMEMGDCLLEKTALNDDEESGKVLLMLGKVQFELQKLVDGYRSHIFQTITMPSESFLNELHILEEMKKCCDEKSEIHEDMIKKQKVKGRLRNSKGECFHKFHSHQPQEACNEYDEEANIFVLRMKSLKQGQSRRFLTLASQHHAAQLYFFKKAVGSLEAIEPRVRFLAERLHINYQFSEPKHDGCEIYNDDDERDEDDDFEDGSETHDDNELSFDYRQNGPVQDVHILKKIEFDKSDGMFFSNSKLDAAEKIGFGQNSFSFQRGVSAASKSAPLFPEKKLDSAERTAQLRSLPSRKFDSYVLPTPDEMRCPSSRNLSHEVPQTRQAVPNLWHLSPLDQHKYEKLRGCEKLSGPIILDTQSVLRQSNTTKAGPFPSPLTEGHSFKQFDPNFASYTKKAKRQAFSGPLTGKPRPNKSNFTADGSIASSAFPPSFSGLLLHTPLPQPSSNPKLSSHVPLTTSSPKITELHELPRPPAHLDAGRPSNRSIHSGPLISKSHDLSTACVPTTFSAASAIPVMPQALLRSYSIPAGGLTAVALLGPLEGSQKLKMAEDVSSLPLTPISESNQHL